jgi:hypothetical protein
VAIDEAGMFYDLYELVLSRSEKKPYTHTNIEDKPDVE